MENDSNDSEKTRKRRYLTMGKLPHDGLSGHISLKAQADTGANALLLCVISRNLLYCRWVGADLSRDMQQTEFLRSYVVSRLLKDRLDDDAESRERIRLRLSRMIPCNRVSRVVGVR
jgi:hypothetical protein